MSGSDSKLLGQFQPQVAGPTPMYMEVTRDMIFRLVNEELARRHQPVLPLNAELTVNIPGGGDRSGENLEIDSRGEVYLTFRWKK